MFSFGLYAAKDFVIPYIGENFVGGLFYVGQKIFVMENVLLGKIIRREKFFIGKIIFEENVTLQDTLQDTLRLKYLLKRYYS